MKFCNLFLYSLILTITACGAGVQYKDSNPSGSNGIIGTIISSIEIKSQLLIARGTNLSSIKNSKLKGDKLQTKSTVDPGLKLNILENTGTAIIMAPEVLTKIYPKNIYELLLSDANAQDEVIAPFIVEAEVTIEGIPENAITNYYLAPEAIGLTNLSNMGGAIDGDILKYDTSLNGGLGGWYLSQDAGAGVPGTGTVTDITAGNGLLGGTITSSGTIQVDTGTGANQILQLDGSSNLIIPNRIEFTDTGVLGFNNIGAGQNFRVYNDGTFHIYDQTAGQDRLTIDLLGDITINQNLTVAGQPVCLLDGTDCPAVGSVTNIATGTGLTGGPITSTGTISVSAGGISATELATDAVTTAKVQDDAITAAKLNQMSATTGQVLKWNGTDWAPAADTSGTGTVTSVATGTGLTGGTITTSGTISIAAGGVDTTQIADSAITSIKIFDGTIANADLADSAVTSAKILDGTIATADLADGSVSVSKLGTLNSGNFIVGNVSNAPASVTMGGDATLSNTGAVTIATSAITSSKISNDTIINEDISPTAAIALTKLGSGILTVYQSPGVGTIRFNDNDGGTNYVEIIAPATLAGNVTLTLPDSDGGSNEFLQTNGSGTLTWAAGNSGTVTSVATSGGLTGGPITATGTISIAAGGVDTTQMADSAVTSAKILDGTIATADLADGAVTSAKILDGTIATADIADGSVSVSKLGTLNSGNFIVGNVSNAPASVTMGGDATLSNTGAITIAANAITSSKISNDTIINEDINSAAAIDLTKLGSGILTLDQSPGVGTVRFNDNDGSTNYVEIIAPATLGSNYTLTLPAAVGGNNEFLQTNASGVLSWASVTSGTVTSVATSGGLTGGPITSSGTISIADGGVTLTKLDTTTVDARYVNLAGDSMTGELNMTAVSGLPTDPPDLVFRNFDGTEVGRVWSLGGLLLSGQNTTPSPDLAIAPTGFVGIGSTAPAEKLTVAGDVLIKSYVSGDENGIFFREGYSDTNKYNLSILTYDHSTSNLTSDGLSINAYDGISFSTGSNTRNEQMRITGTGNVGIGTIAPSSKLYVVGNNLGTVAGDEQIIQTLAAYSGNYNFLDFKLRRHTDGAFWSNTHFRIQKTTDVTKMGFIDFGIDGAFESFGLGLGIGTTTHLAIELSGNVGIGKTSAASKLDVNGVIRATDICSETGTNCIDLSAGVGSAQIADGSIGTADLSAAVNSKFVDTTGDTMTGTLNLTGARPHIYDTDSPTGNGVLQISNNGPANDGVGVETNFLFTDSGGNFELRTDSADHVILQNTGTSSGNVGIGTSAPSEKLDVLGNAKISNDLTVLGDLKMFGSNSYIWTPGTGSASTGVWDTNASEMMMFFSESAQSIGIYNQAPDPTVKLDVTGSIKAGSSTTTGTYRSIVHNSSTANAIYLDNLGGSAAQINLIVWRHSNTLGTLKSAGAIGVAPGSAYNAGVMHFFLGTTGIFGGPKMTLTNTGKLSVTELDATQVCDESLSNCIDLSAGVSENNLVNKFTPPIGTIMAWHKNLAGVPALPADGTWVECNGQVLSDAGSPLNGQTIPNLNGAGRFLRGSTTSGTLQNQAIRNHAHASPLMVSQSVIRYRDLGGGNWGEGGSNDEMNSNLGMGYSENLRAFGVATGGSTSDTYSKTSGIIANASTTNYPETRPVNMSVVWIMRVK